MGRSFKEFTIPNSFREEETKKAWRLILERKVANLKLFLVRILGRIGSWQKFPYSLTLGLGVSSSI